MPQSCMRLQIRYRLDARCTTQVAGAGREEAEGLRLLVLTAPPWPTAWPPRFEGAHALLRATSDGVAEGTFFLLFLFPFFYASSSAFTG